MVEAQVPTPGISDGDIPSTAWETVNYTEIEPEEWCLAVMGCEAWLAKFSESGASTGELS